MCKNHCTRLYSSLIPACRIPQCFFVNFLLRILLGLFDYSIRISDIRNVLNPEDSCQEDHIPVRDVGLGVQKDEQNIIIQVEKGDDINSELMKEMGPKHTTLENNMTLNFITNLTNSDVLGCSPSQPFSRSTSSQQISSYNLGRPTDNSFQPLSYIANDVLHCPQVLSKPTRPFCLPTAQTPTLTQLRLPSFPGLNPRRAILTALVDPQRKSLWKILFGMNMDVFNFY
ncbi:protein Daple [Caerostris extrusa]|uniref:Protein Daple n=1 Tax=Caerostris extrusa TaxID=172846 RepID=A0AAV4XBL6_CAEEX|nr:protein Daple [Caerostris extrusa]